ncbi:RNA-directed DNA polymerase, eukaryota, reverse transcriptase zinc-binding domain protein, partial [Tanacetum coccineum]
MGLHVEGELVHQAARQLGCLILKLPFSYLGSIVGDNMARQQAWGGIVDRVKKKLSNWKMKMLSIGGRLTLVKSVLGSLPIYNFSIFKVPKCVLNELEGIRRKFFNGHAQDSKKASWLNWNNVLMSKDRGGLGVSSLYAINRGLLVKWVWRFVTQKDSLWARSIKAIHGSSIQSGLQAKKEHNSCWRSITKEVESLSKQGIHVLNYMRIKLGDGKASKFWCDSWSDEGVLKEKFPRVYSFALLATITIVSAKLSSRDDSWTWNLEKSGMFSVASVRKMIDDTLIHSPTLISRWNKYVPIKVNVLVWKALNNSIPTRFNISRRGILIDSIICPTCDVGVETVGHLFFSCSMARDISALIARWWKVPIQNFDCYDDWLEWIESIRMSKESKKMMEAVFYSSWWLIWWF